MSKLTDIQAKMFKDISGHEYDMSSMNTHGEFPTKRPYDRDDYKLSPWYFEYYIDSMEGYLVMGLYHRMTNDRFYGFDKDGKDLSRDIISRYLNVTSSMPTVIKRAEDDE